MDKQVQSEYTHIKIWFDFTAQVGIFLKIKYFFYSLSKSLTPLPRSFSLFVMWDYAWIMESYVWFTLAFDQSNVFDPDPDLDEVPGDNEAVEMSYMMSGNQTIKSMATLSQTK